MVIAEAPSREDVEKAELFSDRAGEEFREMLSEAGVDRRETAFIAAVACMRKTPEKDPEMRKALAACAPLFESQLKRLRRHPVLTVGKWATTAFMKREKAIGSVRGFYAP